MTPSAKIQQPVLRPNEDGSYTLDKRWSVPVDGVRLTTPAGFRTDLASVPRPGWLLGLAPNELGGAAPAVAHDFLYQHHGRVERFTRPATVFSRRSADKAFRDLMRACGVPRWKRMVAWVGVRVGGGFIWRPSPSQVRNMVLRLLHTLWQAAAGVLLVDWLFSLPPEAWWIPPIAATLSGVKTLFVAPSLERAVETLYG